MKLSSIKWLSAIGTIVAAPSLAQTPPKEPVSEGEIVVTAQKRTERLLDAPQSVTAITAGDLARLNATQFRDFANTVPALSFTSEGAGKTQVTLRGVTTGVDIGPTVGIYVDEVPYGSSSAFSNASLLALDAGLFDMDRIEVLRGPQGTLYGASTMGGLIKYVTQRPDTGAFGGVAQFGVSGTRFGGVSYNAAAAVNAPIATDKAALRVSGFYSRDGGYIDNLARGEKDVNASRIYGGRAELLLEPADGLSVRLAGFVQNIDRQGTASADFSMTGQPIDGSLDQRRPLGDTFDQRFRLVSGTVNYDIGGATLTSISSYQTVATKFRQDVSAFYVPALAPVLSSFGLTLDAAAVDQVRKVRKFTQELRLASSGSTKLEWLIGGFYTHEKSENGQIVMPYDPAGGLLPVDIATVAIPSTFKELAVFGNLTWHITDRFDISGGLRYSENRQRFAQSGSGILGVSNGPPTDAKDEIVTYLANARYRISDRATAYVRYATGYRPGGPNFIVLDLAGNPVLPTTFASDGLSSYEAGIRAETNDRTFAVDLAAYHIDWRNVQVVIASGTTSGIGNAGGARVTGAELTLTARPTPGLNISGAFAYQHARLGEDNPDLGALKGDRLPNVPEFTAALTVDYSQPAVGDRPRPTAGATLRYVSDRPASFDASLGFPQYQLRDYVTFDLRAGVSFGRVDAQLFVRNLFDVRGQLSAMTQLSAAGGPAQVTILQPRTIGLSASTRF